MYFAKVDERLLALYNEYISKGKEEDFIEMLYSLLGISNEDVCHRVAARYRYWKSKITKDERKENKKKIEAFFASMSLDEQIEFLNKPWEEMPDWLKEIYPNIVKYPEEFNFLRISEEVNPSERQNEVFGSRIIRYAENKRILTTGEDGNVHVDCKRFADICNDLAKKYDLARRPGHKAQRVRLTAYDFKHYTQERVTPKKDKLVTIALATDMPMWYLGGYRGNDVPDGRFPNSGFTPGPFSGKFRKGRKVPDGGDAA